MDNIDVMERARTVLANTFGLTVAEIPDTISAANLHSWNSLHHFSLVAALEQEFGVTYNSDEIPHMTSLDAITTVTSRNLGLTTDID